MEFFLFQVVKLVSTCDSILSEVLFVWFTTVHEHLDSPTFIFGSVSMRSMTRSSKSSGNPWIHERQCTTCNKTL